MTTINGGKALGRRWRTTTRRPDAPDAWAARTNSVSRREALSARTTRASRGHDVRPRSTTRRSVPGPNRAMATTARKKRGTTWTNSVRRMRALSTNPGR